MSENSERILAPWPTDPDDTFISVVFDFNPADPSVGIMQDSIWINSVTLDDGTEIEPTKDQKGRIIEELFEIRAKAFRDREEDRVDMNALFSL